MLLRTSRHAALMGDERLHAPLTPLLSLVRGLLVQICKAIPWTRFFAAYACIIGASRTCLLQCEARSLSGRQWVRWWPFSSCWAFEGCYYHQHPHHHPLPHHHHHLQHYPPPQKKNFPMSSSHHELKKRERKEREKLFPMAFRIIETNAKHTIIRVHQASIEFSSTKHIT